MIEIISIEENASFYSKVIQKMDLGHTRSYFIRTNKTKIFKIHLYHCSYVLIEDAE